MNNPFAKLTDVCDEFGVKLGIKHSRYSTEYGWQLCSYNYHDELNKILKIGRYRYLRKIKNNCNHYFITISLPHITDIEALVRIMERVVMKKWIQNNTWYYTYEQRGETEETCGEGLHIHLLILKNKRKSQVIREISNTFKIAKNYVDVREGKTEQSYNTRLEYLKGKKIDSKLDRVYIDRLFRQKKNLLDIYTNATS